MHWALAQAAALKTDLESTQKKLTAEDFTDPGKQQLVGDLLYSTILRYFALNNLQDELSARAAGMVSFKAPGYGLFKTSLKPQYWFGIPRNVSMDGPGMDVYRIKHPVVEKNNDQEQWKAWNRASGARMSAMEHLVPEMMFSTEENPAHGISAVKALQLAAAEGQKIWPITQTDLNISLAAINLPSDIKTDIRNSVNAGMEVTAHEQPVNFYGSSQVGYIVLDPETGAGGYLIGSGENGGLLIMFGLIQILVSAIFIFYMGPHMWAFFSTPSGQLILGTILSSSVALIARGIEIITNNYGNSCGWANGGIGAGIGALLSLWLGKFPIIGIIAGIAFSGLLPCI
jgi:hypothetical protein